MTIRIERWGGLAAAVVAAASVAAATGCGDETGGGATSTSSGTTSTSSTTDTGTGTGTGTGGAGGCLPASAHADLFAIADSGYCAVAVYEADVVLGFQAPTWGAHGGPLTMVADAAGGGLTITRWKAPAGSSGKLTHDAVSIAAQIPSGAFASMTASDLPFFGWTASSWSGAYPDTAGKIVMAKDGAVAASYDVNGAYAFAGVGDATSGRLFYTGLSTIGATAAGANGLYAADACDQPKQDLGAGTGCKAPLLVSAWGDSSGPVVADRDGNVFAVLASFASGTQEARGFAAAEVARGSAATDGTALFTMPGFGSSLAAIAPRDGKPGKLLFQPMDEKATPLDVVVQAYTVSGSLAAEGTPTKLLTVPATNPPTLWVMVDATDRIWIAAPGETSATFVVLDRVP